MTASASPRPRASPDCRARSSSTSSTKARSKPRPACGSGGSTQTRCRILCRRPRTIDRSFSRTAAMVGWRTRSIQATGRHGVNDHRRSRRRRRRGGSSGLRTRSRLSKARTDLRVYPHRAPARRPGEGHSARPSNTITSAHNETSAALRELAEQKGRAERAEAELEAVRAELERVRRPIWKRLFG